jgi:CRP-like cAMP-binding protein
VEVFENLSDDELARVADAGDVREVGAGEVLFRPGDSSDRMHVVLRGAVEIVRATPDQPEPGPVAYISPGEIIGDMALFTGAVRRSGARVPETALLWSISRQAFEQLVEAFPGYGLTLARIFARRLEAFITDMRAQRRKELTGHLRYFDMLTVVQTLVSSNQTGVLTILDGNGANFGNVLLRRGEIDRARCGRLHGEEAFYEIFLGPEDGEFHFRTVIPADGGAISAATIKPTAMSLLMEAMRLLDELPRLRQRLDGDRRTFQATVSHNRLAWEDARTEPVARALLAALKMPRPLCELAGEVTCSTFTLYQVAARLEDTEQIA